MKPTMSLDEINEILEENEEARRTMGDKFEHPLRYYDILPALLRDLYGNVEAPSRTCPQGQPPSLPRSEPLELHVRLPQDVSRVDLILSR